MGDRDYHGNGDRILKTENGETTLYVNQYYEINLTTGEETSHYYLGGRQIAYKNNDGLKYVHQDHLTGTSLTTDAGGSLVADIKYLPFGETWSETGLLGTDKKFTGQRLDGSGLYYYNARYYDPTIGRFISADTIVQDPANPQTLNRYSYVINNPLKYTDPSGHVIPLVALIAAGVLIGGGSDAAVQIGLNVAQGEDAFNLNPWSIVTSAALGGVTGGIASGVKAGITAGIARVGVSGASKIVSAVAATASNALLSAGGYIVGTIGNVLAGGEGQWNWTDFGAIVAIGSAAGYLVKPLAAGLTRVGPAIGSGAKTAGSAVVSRVKTAGSAVISGAKTARSAVVSGVKTAGSAVVSRVSSVGSAIGSTVDDMVDEVISWLPW